MRLAHSYFGAFRSWQIIAVAEPDSCPNIYKSGQKWLLLCYQWCEFSSVKSSILPERCFFTKILAKVRVLDKKHLSKKKRLFDVLELKVILCKLRRYKESPS